MFIQLSPRILKTCWSLGFSGEPDITLTMAVIGCWEAEKVYRRQEQVNEWVAAEGTIRATHSLRPGLPKGKTASRLPCLTARHLRLPCGDLAWDYSIGMWVLLHCAQWLWLNFCLLWNGTSEFSFLSRLRNLSKQVNCSDWECELENAASSSLWDKFRAI